MGVLKTGLKKMGISSQWYHTIATDKSELFTVKTEFIFSTFLRLVVIYLLLTKGLPAPFLTPEKLFLS